MKNTRQISRTFKSKPRLEGAGVRLKRVFGYSERDLLDPFLLLDDFHSDNPDDYIAGFPWHPHRGIETVTYMVEGRVEHQDSMGNRGVIKSGDVQWMTAGSGIIHQEMPKTNNGMLWGFQLWVNLPSGHKMMSPRYQEVLEDDIPVLSVQKDVEIRVICGSVGGVQGPVRNIIADPQYLDIKIGPNTEFVHQVEPGYTVFTYVLAGRGLFDTAQAETVGREHLVVYGDGGEVRISTAHELRFLLVSGKPIGEPIAWRGPIVMNTEAELQTAFEEYRTGAFVK